MAPHFTDVELGLIQQQAAKGKTAVEIHTSIKKRRARQRPRMAAPHVTKVRLAIRGKTYKRGAKETRGRKRTYNRKWVKKMNTVRKTLIKKTKNNREVRWTDIIKKTRAPKGDPTTAQRAFKREGFNMQARRPREKPQRSPAVAKEREDWCRERRHLKLNYFSDRLDMIIDNKKFDIPTTEKARQYLTQQRVRFHIRLPGEGLQPEMTKPSRKKNRMNTGGHASVCAGISNCRVVLWHYLPKVWSGAVAADLYSGPILSTLKKKRGVKRKYLVLEDNDPTGFKSNKAKAAKTASKIEAIEWPRYSPDLHPLDFALWDEIERRVLQNTPIGGETVAAYKKRLRLTALRLPETTVRKALSDMPVRIEQCIQEHGGNISKD